MDECDGNRKRNLDRRRETSRFAARDRRGKEADIFVDLKEVVPVVEEATVTHVDRIALLRVAATLCRFRKTASPFLVNSLEDEVQGASPWSEETLAECLDGFILVADNDGTILYITESVSVFLGLTQTDLTGRLLKDFMHSSDYDEFVRLAGFMTDEELEKELSGRMTVFRFKSVISPRGRNLNLKSALFKPISFLVRSMGSGLDGEPRLLLLQGCSVPAGQGSANATASALTKGGDSPTGTFMTRHTCDMHISYVSDALNYLLKHETRSLMGTSFYNLVHPTDVPIIAKAMRELFAKGHCRTPYYRLLAAGGALAWVQTEATTISHTTRGQKGQYIICVHYMLGLQAESESLIIATDAQPAGIPVRAIKAEVDDTREYLGRQPEVIECVDFTPLISEQDSFSVGSSLRRAVEPRHAEPRQQRKSSYDEVLQWLFRDQPSSPAPTHSWQSHSSSPSSDPALASVQVSIPVKESFASKDFSPLADGMAACGLRSPAQASSGQRGEGQLAGGTGGRAPRDPTRSTDGSRRVPSLPPADPFPLQARQYGRQNGLSPPSILRVAGGGMHSSMPSTDLRAPSENSQQQRPMNAYEQRTPQSSQTSIDDLFSLDDPDLQCLAPFVAQEDMFQISEMPKDLHGLFPDLNLPEWTPSSDFSGPRAVNDAFAPTPSKRICQPQQSYSNLKNECNFPDFESSRYAPPPQQFGVGMRPQQHNEDCHTWGYGCQGQPRRVV